MENISRTDNMSYAKVLEIIEKSVHVHNFQAEKNMAGTCTEKRRYLEAIIIHSSSLCLLFKLTYATQVHARRDKHKRHKQSNICTT